MAERTLRAPTVVEPVTRVWQRISPRLVPVLAVLTALIVTVPFMIVTGGRGSIGEGLNIAGTAYAALIEGSTGLTINDSLSRDNLQLVELLAQTEGGLTNRELRSLASTMIDLATTGVQSARRYADLFARFPDLTDEQLTELGERIPNLIAIGTAALDANRALIVEFGELDRSDARALAGEYAGKESLSADDRAAIEAQLPAAAEFDDAALLAFMALAEETGPVALLRSVEQADVLATLGIAPDSAEAAEIVAIAAVEKGAEKARAQAEAVTRMDAAGITDPVGLAEQLTFARELYAQGLLTERDVKTALDTELDAAASAHVLVRRPGNRLLVGDSGATGIVYNNNNTPDDPSDDRPETLFLRLGGSVLLFFPGNLESMLVRAVPFIIAGLAVALGFKTGLFNIGAEGQLYAGGTLAAWVGFSPLFAGLPSYVHLPLVIVVSIFGGAVWGAIPGALKAFTGAHEVIVTIMLNFIAIRLVDWLIKSTNPIILLDPAASTPRTPYVLESAVLPSFGSIPSIWFVLAGIGALAVSLWQRRDQLGQNPRLAVRPIVTGVTVFLIGMFLSAIAVRGALHLGFVIMLVAVWFTDWFLNRTTLGFELRTVGSNPNAAKYAGMNVSRNIIMALAMSGALAGLAGAIEVSGVQRNMQPDFFSGVGFEAIAVALLARSNPRNMIPAGLLWGALATGAGLMQVRADISIDLVKIIQALIIMFIAADAIIRYLWRIPKPEEKVVTTFAKGWGG